MERRCEEPHCLQLVPDQLFQIHQDQHLAERLEAEEYEQSGRQRLQRTAQTAGNAAAAELDQNSLATSHDIDTEDDYQMALALNREFRDEEEQRFFRQIQVFAFWNLLVILRNVKSALKARKKRNVKVKA
jgi:hypothetical protein